MLHSLLFSFPGTCRAREAGEGEGDSGHGESRAGDEGAPLQPVSGQGPHSALSTDTDAAEFHSHIRERGNRYMYVQTGVIIQ